MKARKQVLWLLMVLLTVSLVLAACSKKSNDQGSSESAGSNQTSTSEANTANNADKVYQISWLEKLAPFEDGSEGEKFLEKTFNIDFKVVRVDDEKYAEQFNLLVSTGEVPDAMVQYDLEKLKQLVSSEIIAEVSEDFIKENMPKYYEIIMKTDPAAFKYGMINGKNYALPIPQQENKYPIPLAIRSDWLKNTGSEIPKTLQEYEDVFRKFRNDDPDKNGKKDTYALSMPSDFNKELWFHPIFGAFGTNPFMWHNRDGKLVYGFTENGTKEGLKLLSKWYKEGLIDPEFITDKHRTNSNNDIAYKFSAGKIGFLYNLGMDDHQWDNDGHLNAKWVANNPEWKKFFEENKDDKKKIYSLAQFEEIPTSPPGPVYVNIMPPIGPNGQQFVFKNNVIDRYILFSKELENDKGKFVKILEILEKLATDEDTYVTASWGYENDMWETTEDGRMYLQKYLESESFHPQGKITGFNPYINPMYRSNPDFLTVFGGLRSKQRYDLTGGHVSKLPGMENALKGALPSQAKYAELDTFLQEYFIKAILGDVDVDQTFDETIDKWNKNGGEVLTAEANDWASGMK
jgi:putative aldouronate transport system substrate-binding protein